MSPRAAPSVTNAGSRAAPTTNERSLSDTGHTEVPTRGQRRVTIAVVLDFGLSHLGFFTVLSVLPLLLPQLNPAVTAWVLGTLLFMFNLARRASSLLFAGSIGRAHVRNVMILGLLGAAVGYAVMGASHNVLLMAAGLLAAGVGISSNGLAARTYATVGLSSISARAWAFGMIQIAVNVGAAVGPIAGNLLLNRRQDTVLLSVIGGCYVASAVAVLVLVPRTAMASAGASREPLRLQRLATALNDISARHLCLVTVLGGFLYAQFFSAVVLQVAAVTSSGGLRAGVITLNAVVVVAAQYPVSKYCARASATHGTRMRVIAAGVWLFITAMAILAAAGSYIAWIYVAAAVLSVGETVYTPTVDSAFAELPGDRPAVERFNLRQIAVALGESAGSFVGGALFLLFAQHSLHTLYWLALTIAAALLLTGLTITQNTIAKRAWVAN